MSGLGKTEITATADQEVGTMCIRSRILVLALGLSVSGSLLLAEEDPSGQAVPEGTVSPIQKKNTELGFFSGVGLAHEVFHSRADLQFLRIGGRLGRILTDPVGPGILKGNFAVSLELLPAFIVLQEKTTYAASFTLLFRHYVALHHRLRPFITCGAGALYAEDRVPIGTSRLNFTPQIGFGLAFPHGPKRVYFFEYRFHHISNAETADYNPGINSSYLQFGVSIFR